MVPLFVKKKYNTPEEKALAAAIDDLDDDKDKIVEWTQKEIRSDEEPFVIVYKALEESYSRMVQFVYDEYDVKITGKIDWNKILYERKSELDRIIKNHITAFNMFGDDNGFIRKMCLIMDTETVSIFNKGMYEELKDICDYAIVSGAVEGGCPKCFHGKVDIGELKLPPYHPGCECIVRYHQEGTEELI